MRFSARLAAAIAVLTDIEAHKRPVSEALKSWGLSNRFAGAGDRAAIGNLVYDALRRRASHAFVMGADTPRALVLATAVRDWGETPETLAAAFASDPHAPEALSEDEAARLPAADALAAAPAHIRADLPEWLAPRLFDGDEARLVAEGEAMAGRPPLDLRVNTLKWTRERVLKSLERFDPQPAAALPDGIRLPAGTRDSRTPNVQIDEAFLTGGLEVQDFGSQMVAAMAGARPGEQVLDLCAGAGGKTLAMAAAMANKGQIFAYDSERARLAPIYDRLQRNGVRNVQVRPPTKGALDDLVGKVDRVVVDAPCTGSGTWRRRPDAKWKLNADQVTQRVAEQRQILAEAARYVKPGGTLVYITCSIIPDENGLQAADFLAGHPDFTGVAANSLWHRHFGGTPARAGFEPHGVALTPHMTGTDGFFIAAFTRGK